MYDYVRMVVRNLASRRGLKYVLLLIAFSFVLFAIYGLLYLPDVNRYTEIRRFAKQLTANEQLQAGAVLPRPYSSIQLPPKSEDLTPPVSGARPPPAEWKPLDIGSGEDADPETRHRRDVVREMMQHAWSNYRKYAWGNNELRPISKRGHSASIFGDSKIGASIVDGLDTLYIMGLMEEFKQGRDWVADNFDISTIDYDMSVFETNIRFIGGFLSCYALTKDQMFLDKAIEIGKRLLPAFDTPKGIPYALINPSTGAAKNYAWTSSSTSILSELGTLHLEFVYLSHLSGDPIFAEKVMHLRDFLDKAPKIDGLYPNYISPRTGLWGQHHMSMGALGDSFYEYLLKAWLQSNRKDLIARRMYDEAMRAVEAKLLQVSRKGLLYLADLRYEQIEHKMDHLACFSGGLFGLGGYEILQIVEKNAEHNVNNNKSENGNNATESVNNNGIGEKNQSDTNDVQIADAKRHISIGANLTNTCHESYIRTATGLGPECFRFSEAMEAKATRHGDKYYIQRPETYESYFYLWRITHDVKYRDWAWQAVQALQSHCRVQGGFTGLRNVYDVNGPKDDVQQSFLLAETLKYLYLIFSNDSFIGFDKWVYNTEAHPLPIRGTNPAYRE